MRLKSRFQKLRELSHHATPRTSNIAYKHISRIISLLSSQQRRPEAPNSRPDLLAISRGSPNLPPLREGVRQIVYRYHYSVHPHLSCRLVQPKSSKDLDNPLHSKHCSNTQSINSKQTDPDQILPFHPSLPLFLPL